jgi:hypothetical protein
VGKKDELDREDARVHPVLIQNGEVPDPQAKHVKGIITIKEL